MQTIYGPQLGAMTQSWGTDHAWLIEEIICGVFLADDLVLGNLESELITFTSVATLNLQMPLRVHSKALQRMGVSVTDAQMVLDCAEMGAKLGSKEGTSWPKVNELLSEW